MPGLGLRDGLYMITIVMMELRMLLKSLIVKGTMSADTCGLGLRHKKRAFHIVLSEPKMNVTGSHSWLLMNISTYQVFLDKFLNHK